MTRVDFYVLDSVDEATRRRFICRLIEKAYLKKHTVFVQCENIAMAEDLDDTLWSFKDDSFIPHNCQGEGPEPPPPVQLGFSEHANGFSDILINVSHSVPSFYSKFKRIIEIVTDDEAQKATLREHWRLYQQAGLTPKSHKINQELASG